MTAQGSPTNGAIEDALIDDSSELTAVDQAERDDPEPDTAPVSYTGTDFDVEGLVRRLERGDIVIPRFGQTDETVETAGFQRGFVWNRNQMDRFIESLLLGFPIPGIMLVQQQDKRYLVLDGQQRLSTMRAFYRGLHAGKEFALRGVSDSFKGLTYATLPVEQRRQLDNAFIQATIVKTDGTQASLDSVYQVFERLNSGGTQLTPHEIRVALYAGPMVTWLEQLNRIGNWRELYGPESPRLRDQELILRILAFFVTAATYKRPLKKFLNDFMGGHRHLQDLPAKDLADKFECSCELLMGGPGRMALRRGSGQINAALTEALFVAIMRRLDTPQELTAMQVSAAVDVLDKDADLAAAVTRSTADEESVKARLAIAARRLNLV